MKNHQSKPLDLPLDKRKGLLAEAYAHGQAIRRLAVPNESYDTLSAYLNEHPAITETPTDHGRRLTFAEVVYWEVTEDNNGIVLGISQSGYLPLMARLGIDFSGAPFGEDCG